MPIDELGIWCHEMEVSMVILWARTSQQPSTSTIMLKELKRKYLPNSTYQGLTSKMGGKGQWICNSSNQEKSAMTAKQMRDIILIHKHITREASAATPHTNLSERPLDILTWYWLSLLHLATCMWRNNACLT